MYLALEFKHFYDEYPAFFHTQTNHYIANKKMMLTILDKFPKIDSIEAVTFIYNWKGSNDEWFKINFLNRSGADFCVINKELVVTDKALNFLIDSNFFKKRYYGEIYGKVYNFSTNLFEIGDKNPYKFIEEDFPILIKKGIEITNEIDNEWSRRSKLGI